MLLLGVNLVMTVYVAKTPSACRANSSDGIGTGLVDLVLRLCTGWKPCPKGTSNIGFTCTDISSGIRLSSLALPLSLVQDVTEIATTGS